jgi:DNA-directed RNA polymerase subunit RPC12/RpoP
MKEKEKVLCPNCGSEEVVRQKSMGVAFALSFLLFGFPAPIPRKRYHCFNCGLDFKLKKRIQSTVDDS